jgi:hypothetical protein
MDRVGHSCDTDGALASPETSHDVVAGAAVDRAAPTVHLIGMGGLGPFSWRWPDADEAYDRGWAAIVEVDGHQYRMRHGVGRRATFGQTRVRSVTWVEGQPTVEGVEADDFGTTECLLSLIKLTKRHLRSGDAVPAGPIEAAFAGTDVRAEFAFAGMALGAVKRAVRSGQPTG